uniref:Uncharacterized protein n=1 Tax=Candidatus Kentrum sp. TC TaxID=2126339 RepID=A0A450ZXT8_9GAMM|nr:MAG: hypothetical protein BECKTC1821F_GA0114240_102525 [Candidatus Kentron sp. TC]
MRSASRLGRQAEVIPNIRQGSVIDIPSPVIESLNPFIDILNLSVEPLLPLAESCRKTGMGPSCHVGLGLRQRQGVFH